MKSITDGFDALKDAALDLASCGVGDPPHFKHRRTLMMLCTNDPGADGAALADTLVEQATQNWEVGRERYGASPSRQNWRFARVGTMAAHNRSPEVSFERALAEVGGDHWANQVPTCSGVVGYRADGRRSIDLVERVWDRSFNLIELKIGSDTPLFAALEVLDYGVLYAFTRMNARSLGYAPGFSEILDARRIGLRVVAPRPFYQYKARDAVAMLDLAWLEDMMRDAARRLSEMIGGDTVMDFQFDVFPETFCWDPSNHENGDHALAMMAERQPLVTRSTA